LSETFEMESML